VEQKIGVSCTIVSSVYCVSGRDEGLCKRVGELLGEPLAELMLG
jgi:hypothetical protein